MKKYFLACIIAIAVTSSLQAQYAFFLSGHGNFNVPVNQRFTQVYQNGVGYSLSLGLKSYWPGSFIVGTVGRQSYAQAPDIKNQYTSGDLSMTTLQIGVRQVTYVKNLFFVANAGTGMAQNTVGGKLSELRFVADAGAGYTMGKFETIAGINYIDSKGFRPAGIMFMLKTGFRFGF